jgi:hypothetical protein
MSDTARYSLQHLFDQHITIGCTHLCQIAGQPGCSVSCLLLSPGFVLSGCTGFVLLNQHTRYSLHGMFDRVNTREKMHYIPLCLAALIVQLQLQAI